MKNKSAQNLNKLSHAAKLKKYGVEGFKKHMQELGRKGGKAKKAKSAPVDNSAMDGKASVC